MDEKIGETAEEKIDGKADGNNLLIPGAIVVAAVIIAGAIIYINGGGSRSANQTPPAGANPAENPSVLTAPADGNYPVLGSPSASVTIIEFGDFQCPFCGRFFRETERQIIDQYVKTGKARFAYRDFAFLGDESIAAAEAAACANEQGAFWAYHDNLYNYIWDNYYARGKSGENVGAFSSAHLNQFAGDLGLDSARFSACLSEHKHRSDVEKDTADGRARGVNGTPAFFINGKIMVGAQPFSEFKTAIEAALAGK